MIVNIKGNIKEYYAQTLCMLFFPGVKFSKNAPQEPGEPTADIVISDDGENVEATVTLGYNGVTKTASYKDKAELFESREKAEKIICGKAMFACGKALLGITPQWGILTGVRPAKIAYKMIEEGKNKTEIKSELVKGMLINPKKAALLTNIAFTEKKIISRISENTCSLYISIPFCPSRCSYCSFVSFTSPRLLGLLDDYLDMLCRDIKENTALIKKLGIKLLTVYVGGGTPTVLSEEQTEKLLSCISSEIDTSSLEEFTYESGRPDTITEGKLRILLKHGVTRISINPQTLNDEVLESIGRKHTSEQFFNAFDIARSIGIKYINTDVIAGLPNEGFGSFSESFDRIVSLKPENLTVHTLCIKNAADFSKNLTKYGDYARKVTEKCVDYAQLCAKNAEYLPYYIYRQKNTIDNLENVGYCMPGAEGLYNIYMMEEIHSIFAVGAGSVAKLVSRNRKNISRIFEYKYPYEYLADDSGKKASERAKEITEFYENLF